MIRAALLALALLAAACTPVGEAGSAHPLAGRVWDVSGQRFMPVEEAVRRIAAADVALLGETHDNPGHHAIQLRILRAMLAAGRHPALAMEQIDTDRQDPVDAALVRTGATAGDVKRAAQVSHGWDWKRYAPLVTLAIAQHLPVVGINMPRERIRRMVDAGLGALGADEAEALALARTWNPARNAALRKEISRGHCGEEGPLLDKLVVVQRARDAVMADRILAYASRGVAAILGRGHARADLGVPLYLAARAPALRVVSVGLVEVDDAAREPGDYPEAARGVFDFVWFTARVDRADPCATMRVPRG